MNRMLSNIVGFLNGFLAIAFLTIGLAVGSGFNDDLGGFGWFLGFLIGLVLAIIFSLLRN